MTESNRPPARHDGARLDRRDFLRISASAAAAGAVSGALRPAPVRAAGAPVVIDAFDRPDSLYAGDPWESLNPGYWQVHDGALRRKLENRGDWRPGATFPWHWESNTNTPPVPADYDPSLPFGMIWRRDWNLRGNYTLLLEATVRAPAPHEQDSRWLHHQPGYAMMGVGFGSHCLHESWVGNDSHEGGGMRRLGLPDRAAWMACWRDDDRFGIYDHDTDAPLPAVEGGEVSAPRVRAGDQVTIEVAVSGSDPAQANVIATLRAPAGVATVEAMGVDRALFTEGYFGVVARGLLDWQVDRISLEPGENLPLSTPLNELHVAYALGDTLREEEGVWTCRFMALFRSDGQKAEIRVADTPSPAGGWAGVPVAGVGQIVSNTFRRSTAIIDVRLPVSPAEATLYFTVWKDGGDVTTDPRIGSDSTGAGTGFTGKVPESGAYVGRLPRLQAPYRFCGLSCHAIVANRPELPGAERYEPWWIHDQPSLDAYRHLEEFEFQVMLWEDDVWYLELTFPPPSTDDAYKVITTTLAGPTTRWQMMRHWNVLNPGDHDYGMDDVKGPEQLAVRNREGLGQDPEYLRRNFEIVGHLMSGEENPSGTDNPKRWRRWKMPDGDFSLLIMDARLWRTSQDTDIWDDHGWGHQESLYDRTDPTRALLGEEQYAWLQETIRTDSSPLICLTGINVLHTVWTGWRNTETPGFYQRDRVAADYSGWVAAGAERVIELLGSRSGVLSVYGDVHLGCILMNKDHRVYESAFGPIGRHGGRGLKDGFGPDMEDFDGRPVRVLALYHDLYGSPALDALIGPTYWNFLEMHLDPRPADPRLELTIRNLVDTPREDPRGGAAAVVRGSETGRLPTSKLPVIRTIPNAEILISSLDGRPVRGMRSLPDGTVPAVGLIDVAPGTELLVTARAGDATEASVVETEAWA